MDLSTINARAVLDELQIERIECAHGQCAGFLVVDGVRVLAVHCALEPTSMCSTVVELFRRSLKLSVEEFEQLVNASLTREAYVEILRSRGCLAPGSDGRFA
jgi:hypothetical protein|nr:hypothetical protein [uncultured Steroidobacter sp.]